MTGPNVLATATDDDNSDSRHGDGVRRVFRNRHGGVSGGLFASLNVGDAVGDEREAVFANRAQVAKDIGLSPHALWFARQVHGVGVADLSQQSQHAASAMSQPGGLRAIASQPTSGWPAQWHHPPEGDILLTTDEDVALCLYTADCVPVLLSVPGGIAAVHAGWRGTADDAPAHGAKALLQATGSSIEQLTAHLGPAIGPCCYSVDARVAAALARVHAPTAPPPIVDGTLFRVDLQATIVARLHHLGVPSAHVQIDATCTHCSPDHFSHRRSQGRTGRQASLICRPSSKGVRPPNETDHLLIRGQTPKQDNGLVIE